ncbi:MAG: DegT/DnrJ/EryC1/StrS family aminotransferase [Terriglobia bacterium]|jgi:dTDP-4-amino-4,6-dideoxygalactose transaminase
MKKEEIDEKSKEGRRNFLQAGGMALLGLAMPDTLGAKPRAGESLALSGGPKTVNFPKDKLEALTRWPRYGQAEKDALHRLIDTNKFYEELPLFEKEWQAYTGIPYLRAHINGSSAITSMFFAIDLEPGSEIMVPSYDFPTDCLAMRFFSYVPIFIDIDPATGCFDLEDARRKFTSRTRAVFPMHSWGMPCEMDHIREFAKEKNLIVLEDAAHAHGASMQGKKMGTWGDLAIFSFQASKVLPTVEGGMGMYHTRLHYERATAFGEYLAADNYPAESPVHRYHGTGFGQKYRMHPFSAAVGRMQLRTLDATGALVEKNVRRQNDPLIQLAGLSEPRMRPDVKRAYYHANMLLVDSVKAGVSRDALVKALRAEGVGVSTWVYPEQHKLTIYSEPQWWHHPPVIPTSMPGNDYINNQHIFLPLFYGEADEVIDQYVKAFQKVWAHRSELA